MADGRPERRSMNFNLEKKCATNQQKQRISISAFPMLRRKKQTNKRHQWTREIVFTAPTASTAPAAPAAPTASAAPTAHIALKASLRQSRIWRN